MLHLGWTFNLELLFVNFSFYIFNQQRFRADLATIPALQQALLVSGNNSSTMKFTSLILSFLFCANAVSSQNAINSITRNERLHNEISDHIVIESKGFGPWGLETSLLWRKADTLFGKLQLSKAINYFYDSSYTIKYYTFLRILLLDDDVALRLLTSIITDSTKIHWHFDDEMGSEKFNQLLAHEYKIFIQLKYHNGGKLSGTDSHYFGTGIYYFPKSNEKLWNKKYTKFLKLVTPHGLNPN
ncbi:MAG: hypothetical protein IPI88_11900 [Chitinophagaceae bacterium]|nr:hypothetical protein [Chitinophagaceae bacterium]